MSDLHLEAIREALRGFNLTEAEIERMIQAKDASSFEWIDAEWAGFEQADEHEDRGTLTFRVSHKHRWGPIGEMKVMIISDKWLKQRKTFDGKFTGGLD